MAPTPTTPVYDLSKADFSGVSEAEMARVIGRPATAHEVLTWAGIDQQDIAGARVSISIVGGQIELEVDSDRYSLVRQYGKRPDGSLYAHHDLFEIHKQHQGSGLGSSMFLDQVAALKRAGFSEIETLAAGDKGDFVFNGYYTWPRLGYDGDIPAKLIAKLPPQFSQFETVSELMATKAGRDWWKENGGWINVTFDLRDGSYSLRTLEAYMAEKAAKKAGKTDRADHEKRHDERTKRGGEEIDLTPEEEAAADRALDRVAREMGRA